MNFTKRIGTLAALSSLLTASACFKIAPPEPEPVASTLAGRIVVQQSAFSANVAQKQRGEDARQLLVDVQANEEGSLNQIGQDQNAISPTGRAFASKPSQSIGKAKPFDFKPSQIMLTTDAGTATAEQVGRDLALTMANAGLPYQSDIVRCVIGSLCLAQLSLEGKALDKAQTQSAFEALLPHKVPGLKHISLNGMVYGLRIPNDDFYSQQWALEAASFSGAWDITVGEPNVVVAIVDSGIRVQHPDMREQLVDGFDFVEDQNFSGDGTGVDDDPSDPGVGAGAYHGTHVAGIAGARSDNGEGIAGASWNTRILPVRVLGLNLSGTDFDSLAGISWAVGGRVDGIPDNLNPAKVINLSLGGTTAEENAQVWSQLITEIIDTRKDEFGVPLVVAAAGNESQNASTVNPANIPGVITVAASRLDGDIARYSNFGNVVDILAPGGDSTRDQDGNGAADGILSLFGDSYAPQEGTSMATPLVAGALALVASIDPDIDQTRALQLVRQSADTTGQCSQGCGAGLLDVTALLVAAGGQVPDRPQLALNRSRLIFQPGIERLPVSILNLGAANLEWTATIAERTDDVFALTPDSGSVPVGGSGTLEVTLNRGAITSGRALLTFEGVGEAQGQQAFVELFFNDAAAPALADTQVVQVEAFIVQDDETIVSSGLGALARRSEGFAWEIGGLAPGRYVVFATGDDNNDGIFDAQFESFGAYPLATNPSVITVAEAQRVQGVDFALQGGALQSNGNVGTACSTNADCGFAPDAECITDFNGGYCSRVCDDGFCGAGASCEELECGEGLVCNVCLATCLESNQCRGDDDYACDAFGTCTPIGF